MTGLQLMPELISAPASQQLMTCINLSAFSGPACLRFAGETYTHGLKASAVRLRVRALGAPAGPGSAVPTPGARLAPR